MDDLLSKPNQLLQTDKKLKSKIEQNNDKKGQILSSLSMVVQVLEPKKISVVSLAPIEIKNNMNSNNSKSLAIRKQQLSSRYLSPKSEFKISQFNLFAHDNYSNQTNALQSQDENINSTKVPRLRLKAIQTDRLEFKQEKKFTKNTAASTVRNLNTHVEHSSSSRITTRIDFSNDSQKVDKIHKPPKISLSQYSSDIHSRSKYSTPKIQLTPLTTRTSQPHLYGEALSSRSYYEQTQTFKKQTAELRIDLSDCIKPVLNKKNKQLLNGAETLLRKYKEFKM